MDVPIFCTSAGKPVTKAKVVDTFERINAMLGRPIVDHSGAKLYGGHSLRVTGAQWMASIGLPLISIQLMARWDSDVVSRYVGEAPLAQVTAEYRRANAGADLNTILTEARLAVADVQTKIKGIDEQSLRLYEEERRLHELIVAPLAFTTRVGAKFIVARRGKYHVPACRHYPELSVLDWVTKCGWFFGLS